MMYRVLLGRRFERLPAPLQWLLGGGSRVAHGRCHVRHGASWFARCFAWVLRLPRAGRDLPAKLVVSGDSEGEVWRRSFGASEFLTTQRRTEDGCLAERMGPFELSFRIEVEDDALVFRSVKATLCLGALRVRIPAPRIDVRSFASAQCVEVSASATMPFGVLLLAYDCRVKQEDAA